MPRLFETLLAVLCLAASAAAIAAPPGSAARRVVSLGGDVTATIYALDAQDQLVGVDSTSEWPAAARKLPNVGYLRQLNAEGVLALRPALIIANHAAGPASAVAQLRAAGVRIDVLPEARTPAGVTDKIRTIGRLLGREPAADRLAGKLAAEYATLTRRVAAMPAHPRVVFLLSLGAGSPLASGTGTAADAMIALAGGENAVRGYHGYKPVSAEALVALLPQVIVVMRQGNGADADAQAVTAALQLPGVAATPAGTARRVIAVDGEALLGFGPRSAQAALALQRALDSTAP